MSLEEAKARKSSALAFFQNLQAQNQSTSSSTPSPSPIHSSPASPGAKKAAPPPPIKLPTTEPASPRISTSLSPSSTVSIKSAPVTPSSTRGPAPVRPVSISSTSSPTPKKQPSVAPISSAPPVIPPKPAVKGSAGPPPPLAPKPKRSMSMTTSPINPEKPTIAAKPKMNHVAPVPPPGKQLETPLSPKEPTISPTALARLKEAAAMESANKHRSMPIPPASSSNQSPPVSSPVSPTASAPSSPAGSLRKFRATTVVRYDRSKPTDAGSIESALEQSSLSRRSSQILGPDAVDSFSPPGSGSPAPSRPGSMLITKMELTVNTDNKVLEEMILTERDYVYDLRLFIELYLYPLRAEKSISGDDLSDLFVNVEELLPINQRLLDKFAAVANPTPTDIAEIFDANMEDFRLYTQYCARQDQIVHVMNRLIETNKIFGSFLEYNRLRPECRNLNFDAFSIKPIQRLCKYPLLLRELEKTCGDDSVAAERVAKARQGIENILIEINSAKAQVDRLREVEEKLSKASKEIKALHLTNPRAKRYILMDGEIESISEDKKSKQTTLVSKDGHLYLLPDMLIICTGESKFKVKHILPLDKIAIQRESYLPDFSEAVTIIYHPTGEKIYFQLKDFEQNNRFIELVTEKLEYMTALQSLTM